jgi:DNA polymerase III alpha subunit
VTFADQDGFKAHKLLRCIDLNIVIGKLDAKDCAKSSEIFYPKGHLENVFQQYPHIIANTQHIWIIATQRWKQRSFTIVVLSPVMQMTTSSSDQTSRTSGCKTLWRKA